MIFKSTPWILSAVLHTVVISAFVYGYPTHNRKNNIGNVTIVHSHLQPLLIAPPKIKTFAPKPNQTSSNNHALKTTKKLQKVAATDNRAGQKQLLVIHLHNLVQKNAIYPDAALTFGIRGVCHTRFLMTPQGSIRRIHVDHCDPLLAQSVVHTITNLNTFSLKRWWPKQPMVLTMNVRFV